MKESISGSDTSKIKSKSEDLTKVLQDIGTKVYQQAAAEAAKQQQAQQAAGQQQGPQPGQQPPPSDGSGQGGDNVVDADYKVK